MDVIDISDASPLVQNATVYFWWRYFAAPLALPPLRSFRLREQASA